MIKKESEIPEIWSHKLTKIYGRGEKSVKAVNKIDISTKSGVHGFLGPNGAGKTSTINMLIGAISITDGKARIKGEDAGSIRARRIIGFLPQDPAFYDTMTGEQYLIYIGELGGLRRHDAKYKTLELLENLKLLEARDREIGKYSEGMKQRIGIAAALIHEPELLILDEPTSNLDPIGRANIIKDIKELSKKISVFVSSHILSEIEQMCENVTMINKGKIVLTDTIKNIKKMHSIKSGRNMVILDTNSNEKIIQQLKSKDFIINTWMDENNNKIHIITKDIESLQKSIPKLIIDNNVILREFHQPEISLQDIFIEIMQDEMNIK
ncbi:MAG: ABC transporter ATP-binding protein [Candidatus Lokiarchaeota archaeon]|nr:ABC transporter ATP-binding protein [Candidatus Lokiarchaeota archaeon]